MIELYKMGGPLHMGILTIILTAGLIVAVFALIKILNGSDRSHIQGLLGFVKSIGLFVLVAGLLFQMLGLYSAFQAIEEAGSASPALLAGGLKVSSITTIYGMISFVILYVAYFGMSLMINSKK
ncbi:MotA/TolQ/ExbB proton channel family protein [Marinoscillum sp.]|uniref:MotA/TolQ/ExbB proton channel family protein n=1 Tax=Marinoscillum sp. TaxID=2024838 RepID=UPI003BAACB66